MSRSYSPRSSELSFCHLETTLGVQGGRLEPDYRQFLLETGGGVPKRRSFRVASDGGDDSCFINFFYGIDACPEHVRLDRAVVEYSGRVPYGLIPIARDMFGNLVLIDTRDDGVGAVCFWDHEREDLAGGENWRGNVVPLATGFLAFFDSLESDELERAGVVGDPLVEICQSGDLECLRRVLDDGTSPDYESVAGESLAELAAFSGHESLVDLLIERGCDKGSALEGAISGRWQKLAVRVAKAMASDALGPRGASTWLHFAAEQDCVHVIDFLLGLGMDIDVRDNRGMTPRIQADAVGSSKASEFLRARGAR